MSININELRETLEINRNDMISNKMLINELIIDDIMVGLGYNKKRDKSVKRLYNDTVDWEVISSDIKLAVKVFGLDEQNIQDELSKVYSFCTDKRFSILLITNGEGITVTRFNKEKLTYDEVIDISITQDNLSDIQEIVLNAISKDTFDMGIIDNIINSTKITYEKVVNILTENKDIVMDNISKWLQTDKENVIKHYDRIINTLTNPVDDHSELNGNNENNTIEHEDEIEQLKKECDKYKDDILSLNNTIEQLTNQISSFENNAGTIENNNIASELKANYEDIIDKYIEQIRELTNDLSNAKITIDDLTTKIDEQEKQLKELSGADRQKAIELLNVIEDSNDLERNYVAVVNTELMQFDKLYTFIGRLLQKLYELKNFEASQYIFNADLFKLIQPAVRNDLIMNNKAYDIDVKDINEDEALNKLRILFSHFNDIVFECKKIGTLIDNAFSIVEEDNTEEVSFATKNDEVINLDDVNDSIEENKGIELTKNSSFEQGFDTEEQGDWENINEELEQDNTFGLFKNQDDNNLNTEDNYDSQSNDFENQFNIDEFNEQNNDNDNMIDVLLVQNLSNIDSLVWTEENVIFSNIKYIGTQDVTFAINCSDYSYDNLLCKCIDAILALETYEGNSAVITELKQKDFSYINNSIKLYTEEYRNYPRINGTKYAIVEVSSVQQVATILLDICNALNISADKKYIYFEAKTNSKFIIDNYGYEEDSVQLRETEYYTANQSDNESFAIIKGDMFNNIMVTKNSLKAHSDIILDTVAVKTKYLAKQVDSIDEVQIIISNMIEEAINQGLVINYNAIGNIVGEQYKILSFDESDVTPEHTNFMINGQPVYCSRMENWQIPHTLVKVHTTLFNNTAIALKTKINVNAVNYYGSEFETTEPSLSLAIKSFVDYIVSCVKNN